MPALNKKSLSERDICSKFITPALVKAQWDLTQKERADRVRKRNYFGRYAAKARAVMEALLEKYADQGQDAFESSDILKIAPFPNPGTPVEIIREFGGRKHYQAALRDLKTELYNAA